MPRFIASGPDIPERLLWAHEEGRVVFFCAHSYRAHSASKKGTWPLLSHSSPVFVFLFQGGGLVDPDCAQLFHRPPTGTPRRAITPSEGLLGPRVARAHKIIRLHPLRFPRAGGRPDLPAVLSICHAIEICGTVLPSWNTPSSVPSAAKRSRWSWTSRFAVTPMSKTGRCAVILLRLAIPSKTIP